MFCQEAYLITIATAFSLQITQEHLGLDKQRE